MQTGGMVDEPSLIAKQDDDLVVRTSERPPETEPTCPRTGPPNRWFEKYGLPQTAVRVRIWNLVFLVPESLIALDAVVRMSSG